MKAKTLSVDEEFLENFTSTHTRISYLNDLTQFFDFLHLHFPKITLFQEIERIHIIKFRNWLTEIGGKNGQQGAPKTICRKLSCLSSYFDYLVEKNHAQYNPTSSVKRPRKVVLTPTHAISSSEIRELIASIDQNSLSGPMHKAILLTFFLTGLRKNEILKLKRKDLKKIKGQYYLNFRGKGGKSGQKLIHPTCALSLDHYLATMKIRGREHHLEDWLFRPNKNPSDSSNLDKPLNPKTINEIIRKYALKIGLSKQITPHSARASFITELLNEGVDLYSIALEVGHTSVNTTQEYDKRRQKIKQAPILKLKI